MSEEQTTAMNWLLGNDTGQSSKAIMAHMLGSTTEYASYPHDPSDLGRCLRLLELIPSWKARLPEMAKYGSQWNALANHWTDLALHMEEEVGIDWSKGHRAKKTYALMQSE